MSIPIQILRRPFAVEPTLNIMMPDGIFDSSIPTLDIAFYVTNTSDKMLEWFWIRPSIVGTESFKIITANQYHVDGPIEPGASYLVRWLCDFSECPPGKHDIKIEFGAQIITDELGGGFDGFFDERIFVSRTTYRPKENAFTCEVPEGTLNYKILEYEKSRPLPVNLHIGDDTYRDVVFPPTILPRSVSGITTFQIDGSNILPFNDPWWKIIAWIVAAIAGIAAILAAKAGKGTATIGVGGEFNADMGEGKWCIPDPRAHPRPDLENIAGILAIIATTAIRVGMADHRDPWQRGRDRFPEARSDLRVSEAVSATIDLPDNLPAGSRWAIPIKWKYDVLKESGAAEAFSVSETSFSENVVQNVDYNVPVSLGPNDLAVVKVYLEDGTGRPYRGEEVFGQAAFGEPSGRKAYRAALSNVDPDGKKLPEGWFAASLHLEKVRDLTVDEKRGRWIITFSAQLTNGATRSMEPEVAATFVGGDVLLAPASPSKVSTLSKEKPICQPDKSLSMMVQ